MLVRVRRNGVVDGFGVPLCSVSPLSLPSPSVTGPGSQSPLTELMFNFFFFLVWCIPNEKYHVI